MTAAYRARRWKRNRGALVAGLALVLAAQGWGQAPREEEFKRKIMAGDRLRITVAEDPSLNRIYAVAGDGTIDLNLIGRVQIADKTTDEVAAMVEHLLEQSFFEEATVDVTVAEFVEGAIQVMGEVLNPGAIPFKGDDILTLVEAITMRGGFTRDSAGTEVRILRWRYGGGMERQVLTVDVQSMFDSLDFSKDQFLRPRDIILVPKLGKGRGQGEFLVLGEVVTPGFHPCSEGLDVIRAVTRAGGTTREAKLNAARLLKPDSSGNYAAIPLDLSRLFGAADMSVNVAVQSGDILFIPSATQAVRGQVFLLGEVARQGSVGLPLDQDITLAKTILGAGGFSEFANENKVRILRTAPDGSKQTLNVDVGRILKTGSFEQDVPLQNGDVIIVPEKVLGL